MLLALFRNDVSSMDGPYRSSNPSPSSFVLVEPSFHSTISQVVIVTFFINISPWPSLSDMFFMLFVTWALLK